MSASNRPMFTPGPWAVRPDIGTPAGTLKIAHPEWPRGSSDPLIAAVFGTEQEQGANARLISAAPEMFEALRALRECETQYVNGNVWVKAGTANLDAVCAALAKAEGRA